MKKYNKLIAKDRILGVKCKDLPERYGKDLQEMLKHTLAQDVEERWSAKEILGRVE